jgi:hypothetical protein
MVGMTLFWRKAAVITTWLPLLLMGSAAAQNAATSVPAPAAKQPTRQAAARPKHHGTSKPSPVVPEPPAPAPVPLTPEQMAPTAPQVTYSNGLLTIVANNSTLSDILRAVAARTGASLDAPPQLTSERVAARIGPASPREVLSDLLTGPRFDYILVGSDGDPNGVRNIILTPNQSSASAGASVAMAQPGPQPAPAADQEDDDDDQASTAAPESPPPGRMQPSPGRRQFVQPQPPDQVAQPTGGGEGGGQQQVKTPEQLLEQLRKIQQQPPPSQQPNDQR